jgi:hypothetical protein
MTLSITTLIILTRFHYAQCHCAECRDLILNVSMLSAVMLSVVTLSVVMLNVVMPSVVAPKREPSVSRSNSHTSTKFFSASLSLCAVFLGPSLSSLSLSPCHRSMYLTSVSRYYIVFVVALLSVENVVNKTTFVTEKHFCCCRCFWFCRLMLHST